MIPWLIDTKRPFSINVLKFLLGFDAWENKTKYSNYSSLNVDVICFALFPQFFEAKLEF